MTSSTVRSRRIRAAVYSGETALPPQRIWTASLPDPSRPLVQQVVVFEHELDSTGIQHAVLLKFGTAFCWYALPPATGVPTAPTFPPFPGVEWTREFVADGQFEPAGWYELHGTYNGEMVQRDLLPGEPDIL